MRDLSRGGLGRDALPRRPLRHRGKVAKTLRRQSGLLDHAGRDGVMNPLAELHVRTGETAVLDSAHLGDIRGALGTIRRDDIAPRNGWWTRLRTLLAILGPGLIVMVGDNDAGAFGTYTQAGQDYGTALLWTLVLLVPVLYVNQEMVLRLGTVSGVGHARLIL